MDLPIERMTLEDKLRAMEELWQSLCRNPGAVPMPDWHQQVLAEREQLVQEGKAHFSDWPDARRRIDQRTS